MLPVPVVGTTRFVVTTGSPATAGAFATSISLPIEPGLDDGPPSVRSPHPRSSQGNAATVNEIFTGIVSVRIGRSFRRPVPEPRPQPAIPNDVIGAIPIPAARGAPD